MYGIVPKNKEEKNKGDIYVCWTSAYFVAPSNLFQNK